MLAGCVTFQGVSLMLSSHLHTLVTLRDTSRDLSRSYKLVIMAAVHQSTAGCATAAGIVPAQTCGAPHPHVPRRCQGKRIPQSLLRASWRLCDCLEAARWHEIVQELQLGSFDW